MKSIAPHLTIACLLGCLLAAPALPAKTPATIPHRLQWQLSEFTWVQLVPKESGTPNEHPVTLESEALIQWLGSVQSADPKEAQSLFAKDELAALAGPLCEALKRARPEEDVLLLSTHRRGTNFMIAPTAITARLFWQDGALNLIVHDARFDFMDRYRGTHVPPTFTFGSRAAAGAVKLASAEARISRPDWLVFFAQPMPSPVVTPKPGPATVAPVSVPATRSTARDAAYYAEQEQRLRALKHLRDENLITQEEYDKKREEILKEL